MTIVPRKHVGVIGAGMGGLTAAALLASRGFQVSLFERATHVGGKMRRIALRDSAGGSHEFDGGPTVLTMRSVFDELFTAGGESLDEWVSLQRQADIARHFFPGGNVLDLYTAAEEDETSLEQNIEAIRAFSDTGNAMGYQRMSGHFRRILSEVYEPFMMSQRPTVASLLRQQGLASISAPWRMDVTRTLWDSLSSFFSDDRLIRLFGRYATYCGSSPFEAPATLGIISEVERQGVWTVDGGMHQLAKAVADLAVKQGVTLYLGAGVSRVTGRRKVRSIITDDGVQHDVDAIVCNADIGAMGRGDLGPDIKQSGDSRYARSLSAVVHFCVGRIGPEKTGAAYGQADNDLLFHNVFFSNQPYLDEFDSIFKRNELPKSPTVYVCAQDRKSGVCLNKKGQEDPVQERLYCLTNAPAFGNQVSDLSIRNEARHALDATLNVCGHRLVSKVETFIGPENFETHFPGSHGAIYGPASHGWKSTLDRKSAVSSVRNLFFAGGSVHPGAGVPMAAISGRLAADACSGTGVPKKSVI